MMAVAVCCCPRFRSNTGGTGRRFLPKPAKKPACLWMPGANPRPSKLLPRRSLETQESTTRANLALLFRKAPRVQATAWQVKASYLATSPKNSPLVREEQPVRWLFDCRPNAVRRAMELAIVIVVVVVAGAMIPGNPQIRFFH